MANWTEKIAYIFSLDDSEFNFQGSLAQLTIVNDTIQEMLSGFNDTYDQMIDLASSFETEMANVSTLLDTDVQGIDRYKDAIIKLSTEIPESADGLAQGLYQVISAGVDAGDAMSVLEVSSRAAVAGMTDTFTSVDAITTILNAYNMDASKASEVSDILFQTVKMGKTTFGELSGYVGTFATNAASLGIELTDVSAAMATMTKSGLNTARSATALDAIMREITKKGDIVKLFKEAGYESAEVAIQTEGLQGAIRVLGEQSDKSGKKFKDLWGEEALRGATIINQNFEMAKSDLDSYADVIGTTAGGFEKASDTLEQAEQMRINAHDALLLKMGQDVLPMHKAYNEALAGIYRTMGEMPAFSRIFLSGTMVAARGLSGLAGTTSTWMRNIAGIREGYQALKPALEKIKALKTATDVAGDSTKMAKFMTDGWKKALGGAGLTAAIGFTVTQLFKLKEAIFDYVDATNEAEKREQEMQENLAEAAANRTKESNLAIYKDQLDRVSKFKKINEEIAKLDYQYDSGRINQLEREKQRLYDETTYRQDFERERKELLSVGLINEANTSDEIAALSKKGFEIQKEYDEAGIKTKEKVIDASQKATEGQINEYTSLADQVIALKKQLEDIGGQYYLPDDFETLDDKKLQKIVDALTKKINQKRLQNEKEYQNNLNKLREQNAKALAKYELEELKKNTIEKTDFEIKELEKAWNKQLSLAEGNKERQEQINIEYEAKIRSLYEQREVDIKGYYDKQREELQSAMEKELAEYKNKEEMQAAIREKYRLLNQELNSKEDEENLNSERERNEKIEAMQAALLGKMSQNMEGFTEQQEMLWNSIMQASRQALTTPRDALKTALNAILDYVKAQVLAMEALVVAKDIASKGFFGVVTASKKVALIEAAFGLARAAVAKFETSGIPKKTGLAIVEPKDVIINPSQQNNPVVNDLADKVAERIGVNSQPIIIQVDKRTLGTLTIEDIREQNKLLPRNSSVFDASIKGTS